MNTLYTYRLKYDKSYATNLIAKLILNSLYGKFGMNINIEINNFIKTYKIDDYHYLEDSMDFDNGYSLVTTSRYKNQEINSALPAGGHNSGSLLNIHLPIAIAVTAYARMHMSSFKVKYGQSDQLLYSDTDSLYLSCPFPYNLV